jgi:hypothetical protein
LPPARPDLPPAPADAGRYTQPRAEPVRPDAGRGRPVPRPPQSRNGRQSPNYQR